MATALALRDRAVAASAISAGIVPPKRVHYLSLEFLIGRLLSSDGRDQQLVSQAATLLQADTHDGFAVAAALPESQDGLRRAAARLGPDPDVIHLTGGTTRSR